MRLGRQLSWVTVAGGICSFGDRQIPLEVGDLEWCRTPLTPSQAGRENADEHPLILCSFFEALVVAEELGARLPTSVEWEWMAAGSERRQFPWGSGKWNPELANLEDSGTGGTIPVGQFQAGATPDGVLDVAGNVWEWTTTETPGDGRVIRGGSFSSKEIYARTSFLNAMPAELRSRGTGLRLVRDP
jgi:formylglycine-generating enzyme